MRILLDIGHPAHVHYFRNALSLLEKRGHRFLITTRDKEVTLDLLKNYGLNYICTGKNKSGVINKFFTMIRNDVAVYRAARTFKPDLFLSFFSPFASHIGWLTRKPVIGFTDTEFAKLSIKLTLPFTDHIFTPHCFWDDFGKKHYRFKGYMETFYLHPNYFTPDINVLKKLDVSNNEQFFIMRFVSFNAGHDTGESGIDMDSKISIAEYLASKGKLFISSEGQLPHRLEKYKMRIAPEDFHSVLSFASLYIGEGITTASECAQVGTPAILINTLTTSYIKEQEQLGLVFQFKNAKEALNKIMELTREEKVDKIGFIRKKDMMVSQHIDCTAYMTELIDQFPQSIKKIRQDASYNFAIP